LFVLLPLLGLFPIGLFIALIVLKKRNQLFNNKSSNELDGKWGGNEYNFDLVLLCFCLNLVLKKTNKNSFI